MAIEKLPEVWLRGNIEGIPLLLQPVAHALLQATEEITELMHHFPDDLLWQTTAGVASPGFHLQHISGVLDRLFTYAKRELLTNDQLHYLQNEGKQLDEAITSKDLVVLLQKQMNKAIEQMKSMKEETLLEFRGVGRAQLPSTVLGLLFHAAEHTMRHTGQLLVTVNVLKAGRE